MHCRVDLPVLGLTLTAFVVGTHLIRDGRIEETDMLEGAVPLN